MNAKSGFRRFRRFSFGSGDAAEEVDRELSFHLEEASRELMATGLDARAAREEAERRFGPVEHYREE
ncbi:MAG TPA: permease prefix domain 1-containing protein, partial [Thermoanaerobaculia bacterium]|nr:permease prefix domain 1-containing protein [Thermoanaerobaculia bacterium]